MLQDKTPIKNKDKKQVIEWGQILAINEERKGTTTPKLEKIPKLHRIDIRFF